MPKPIPDFQDWLLKMSHENGIESARRWSSSCDSVVMKRTSSHRMRVQFLTSLSGLRIWCCGSWGTDLQLQLQSDP